MIWIKEIQLGEGSYVDKKKLIYLIFNLKQLIIMKDNNGRRPVMHRENVVFRSLELSRKTSGGTQLTLTEWKM